MQMRPLDPAFPIERQIAVDADAVVLVNLFTLDKADENTFLKARGHEAAAGFHLDPASSRNRREPGLPQLRGLGIDGRLPRRIRQSRVQVKAFILSVVSGCFPASIPEGRDPGHLRRLEPRSDGIGTGL